jgi:hypothetical protein
MAVPVIPGKGVRVRVRAGFAQGSPPSPPGTGQGGGVLVGRMALRERVFVRLFVSVLGVMVVVLGTPVGRAFDLSEGVFR